MTAKVTAKSSRSDSPSGEHGFTLVSWNLAGATNTYRAGPYLAALDYLREDLSPQIALLQEVRLPLDLGPEYQVFARSDKEWGSAVAVRGIDARTATPLAGSVLDRLGSYLAFADLYPEGLGWIRAVSVHSSTFDPPTSLLEGMSSDLVGRGGRIWHSDLIFDGLVGELTQHTGSFIIGGDWNESPFLWDEVHGGTLGREFFERATRAGWVDCMRRFSPIEVQTWFRAGDQPYQDDHVFVDAELGAVVEGCVADSAPAERGYSDHAPLVVAFASTEGSRPR